MLRLYADECANGLVIQGVRERGVNVLTAQDEKREGAPDSAVLDRATELDRVLFSQDDDLLAEATRRQRAGEPFSGVIYVHQGRATIRACIEDLVLLATLCEPSELRDRVEYLPL